MVRNGYPPEHSFTTAIGDVSVQVPRIRSKEGEPVSFASSIIPKYLRRSSSISAWATFVHPKGISEGDVASVLEMMLGGEAEQKLSILAEYKGALIIAPVDPKLQNSPRTEIFRPSPMMMRASTSLPRSQNMTPTPKSPWGSSASLILRFSESASGPR